MLIRLVKHHLRICSALCLEMSVVQVTGLKLVKASSAASFSFFAELFSPHDFQPHKTHHKTPCRTGRWEVNKRGDIHFIHSFGFRIPLPHSAWHCFISLKACGGSVKHTGREYWLRRSHPSLTPRWLRRESLNEALRKYHEKTFPRRQLKLVA